MDDSGLSTPRSAEGSTHVSELISELDERNMIPEETQRMISEGEFDDDPRAILERILEERR